MTREIVEPATGRNGEYPPGVGMHVTRAFHQAQFEDHHAYVGLAETAGITPKTITNTYGDVVKVWPAAFATCTCKWSRPAPTPAQAEGLAFIHEMNHEHSIPDEQVKPKLS